MCVARCLLVAADVLRASQSIATTSGRLDMTFTTLETFARGFGFAALASSARGRATGFFRRLDEPLVAGEIGTASLLAATLRLITLGLSTSHGGSFDETLAALKIGTLGLWSAALVLRALGLSTSHGRSFDEAFATVKAGAHASGVQHWFRVHSVFPHAIEEVLRKPLLH